MIKLHYGTEKERKDLADKYVKIFPDLSQMNSDWLSLRKDIVTNLPALKTLLPKDIEKLLKKPFTELVDIYELYVANKTLIGDSLNKKAKLLFSYDRFENGGSVGKKQSARIAKFFMNHAEEMKIYTCHYCDMAYINAYPTGPRKKNNHFDLDHVLDKGNCPILALCFFNFVPVCPVCNGRIKSTKQVGTSVVERKLLSPTNPEYDFENKVTIWVDHPDGKCSTFGFEKRMKEYELKFDTHKAPIYEKEIKFFRLEPRYNFHKCEALRLMDLKERYTHPRIVEMARLITGDNNPGSKGSAADAVIERIKKDLFAEDFVNVFHRSFGKLHRDVMK